MDILFLAWKNLWRNRRRTLITVTALSFSLMLMQAFHNLSTGVYSQMVASGVRAGAGHLALYRGDYVQSRDEKLVFVAGALPQNIRALPRVEAALPRVYLPALAQSSRESRGILLMGIDPEAELAVNPFLKNLPRDERLRPGTRDALVGERLLRELQIVVGNKFVVTLQGRGGPLVNELLRVRGAIRSGIKEIDGAIVMIAREKAARLGGIAGQIHELAVILATPAAERQVLPQLRAMVAGQSAVRALPWEKSMPNLANAIKLDYASQKFIFVVILLIVTIGVVNTLLMSVMERIREFGVILAIGASPWRLFQIILSESLLLGAGSLLLGTLLGALATWYLVEVGIDLRDLVPQSLEVGGVVFDPVMRAAWDFPWMVQIGGYVVLICLLASLYPAYKATRIAPAEAMRHS